MSLCPSSSCMMCRSVPCSSRWVAKEWRSICTCTQCLMSARCAVSFSTFTKALAEYGSPGVSLKQPFLRMVFSEYIGGIVACLFHVCILGKQHGDSLTGYILYPYVIRTVSFFLVQYDAFSLFLNMIHMAECSVIQMQIYTKKQKNQQVGWFCFVKALLTGIYCCLMLPAPCILGFQQRIEEVQAP